MDGSPEHGYSMPAKEYLRRQQALGDGKLTGSDESITLLYNHKKVPGIER